MHLDIGGEILIESFFPKALGVDFLKLAIEILMGDFDDSLNIKFHLLQFYLKVSWYLMAIIYIQQELIVCLKKKF